MSSKRKARKPRKPRKRPAAAPETPRDIGGFSPPARLPCDTPGSYAALCRYAAQPEGERSLLRLATEALGYKTDRHVRRWSSAHDWQARITAWDDARRQHRWSTLESAREARLLAQVEADVRVQTAARDALAIYGIPILKEIAIAGSTQDFARIQAIQALAKLSGYQTEPRDATPKAEVSIQAVIAALERAGVRPETLEQLDDDLRDAAERAATAALEAATDPTDAAREG